MHLVDYTSDRFVALMCCACCVLYPQARDHFERQQPAEKRIIEYICSIPDPAERRAALDKAVEPGPTRYTDTHDYLWATPQVGSAYPDVHVHGTATCVCVCVGSVARPCMLASWRRRLAE